MKKLVINLPDRKDRRDLFHTNNSKLQDWRYIEAVNGFDISYQDVLDMGYDVDREGRSVPAAGVQRMKKGEIGCSISHLNCWKEVVAADEPMIIMEDDTIINWDLWDEKYYEEVVSKAAIEKCDFLYLQHNDAYLNEKPEHNFNHPTDEKLINPNYPYNMTAYVLTPKAASILIKNFEKKLIVVDEYLPMVHDYNDDVSIWALKDDSCNQIPRTENKSSIEVNEYLVDIFQDYKNVHFCTIGTDEEKTKNLFTSARKHDIPLKNLGHNAEWEDDMEGFGGGPKIKMMYDFVNSEEVDDMDIVFFTDGYDTFFVDDGQTIIDRYIELDHDLLWAGETHLWPCENDDELSQAHGVKYNQYRITEKNPDPNKPASPYIFLNSGGYIGRAWIIKELFSEYKSAKDFCTSTDHNSFVDDQEFCQRLFVRDNPNWKRQTLDYDCYIFQTNDDTVSKLPNGQMYNPKTNTCGCVYHGNNISVTWKTYERLYQDHVDPTYNYGQESAGGVPSLFNLNQYGRFDVLEKDMIIVEFMDRSQCGALIDMAMKNGGFASLPGDKFPAQEIRLRELNLWEQVCKVWEESIYPIVEKYWSPMEMYGMRDAFIMRYAMDTQRSLNLHNDASLVTGSVKLNDDYEGGELIYPRQGISNSDVRVGRMILFPGMVTHGHQSTPLTKGEKFSLTMWSSRYPGDII